MCGIAGFIDPSLNNKEQADSLLEKMLESIAYRGPIIVANGLKCLLL